MEISQKVKEITPDLITYFRQENFLAVNNIIFGQLNSHEEEELKQYLHNLADYLDSHKK